MSVDNETEGRTTMSDITAAEKDSTVARRKTITAVLTLPLFFLIFLPAMFLGLLHSPAPDGLPVAVIGDTPQANAVAEKLAAAAAGFDVQRSPNADIAQDQLRDLDIRAAFDPVSGALYTASAGGMQDTAATSALFSAVARSSGSEVVLHDVVPLPSSDRMGTSALYIGIGAIVGGFLSGLIVCMVAARLRIGWQALTVVVMSAIVAGIETLYGWGLFDIFPDRAGSGGAVLFGLALVSGLVTLAGMRLIGPTMLMVSILVLIFGGVTASGLTVPLDMAPDFYRGLHEFLPTARGLSALRSVIYFDDAAIVGDLSVVGGWMLAAVSLLGLTRRKKNVPGMSALEKADEALVEVGV